MDIKEVVIESLRTLIIPELDEIKKQIAITNIRLDGIDKRFDDNNKRFDDMNKRLEDFNKRLEDFNKRFDDINKRFEDIYKRFEEMNKRMDDMRFDFNKRIDEMRKDVNSRFEEHFNFNMKRFDSIELQIHTMLAEIRELRMIYEKKVDMEDFRRLEDKYNELLKEILLIKQKVPV